MAKNNDSQVSAVRRAKHGWVLTTFFSVLAVLWLYPIFLVAINAIKKKAFITRNPFALPDDRSFFGFTNLLHLTNPIGIIIIYLGFGAGLAVFMFCGFVKSIPLEIEEAAMIDGCTPLQTFFQIVFPIMKPTTITVCILQAMWIWNDYLLPYLVLDLKKYKTIPIAVQYLKGGYGSVDWGTMMAVLVLAIIPVIIFYVACQKYIIEGVVAGAVKG